MLKSVADRSQLISKIDWYKPTLCRFYALLTKSWPSLVRLNILAFVRVILFTPFVLPSNYSKIVLISYFRRDLLQDFDCIIKHLSKDYVKIVIKPYQGIKLRRIYISDVIFSFYESSKIIGRMTECSKHIILARGVIFFSILEGIKIVRYLADKNAKVDSVLSLMEMQASENIIAQYFRITGAKTFAYQHGYYHDAGIMVSRKTHIPVNYLASVCETALVWGETSKVILERYTTADVICVGKPFLLGSSSLSAHSDEVTLKTTLRHFVAILDHSALRDENIHIMKSLSKFKHDDEIISFIAHPDDAYDYSQFNSSRISHDVLSWDKHCIVANNSSAILQYGRVGFSILLFRKSGFCNFISEERLSSLSVVHKGDLSFYNMDRKSCKAIWSDFIHNYGNECLGIISKTIAQD